MWDPRAWLQSRVVELGNQALARQPDAITLTRSAQAKWRNPESAERLAAPLRRKGFVDLGIFDIEPKPGYRLGILLNETENVAAYLNELPTGSITFEMSVRYVNGTTTAIVGYGDNGVPRPPFFRVIFAGPNVPTDQLFERLLRERPSSGIKTITADNVIAEYQAAYAKLIAFTKGMGLSAAQVAKIVTRARQPATYVPSQQPPEKGWQPSASAQAQPTVDAATKEIPCPHCGQLNEKQREVCWACFKLMNGQDRPAVAGPSSPEQPYGAVPFALLKHIAPGERVLWHGRPLDKLDFRNVPFMAFPIGLLALGAGLFFLRMGGGLHLDGLNLSQYLEKNLFLLIFSGFFFFAGLIVVGGPFLQRFFRRGDFYAITDRRVLRAHEGILGSVMSRGLESVAIASIINETWEGAGDIEIIFGVWTSANFNFRYVENVRDVAAILHLARQEAAARPLPAVCDGDAPPSVARLVVPLHCLAMALCALIAVADVAAILQSGGKILSVWAANQGRSFLPPAASIFIAPPMIWFLYRRLTSFQARTRVARTADVAFLAVFNAVCLALAFWGDHLSAPKTPLCFIAGLFLVIGAKGRRASPD